METSNRVPKTRLWASYIIQGIVVLMFLMGAVNNIFMTESAVNGAVELGYTEDTVFNLGIVLLISTVLFAIPRTSFIGAILLTAWLGGAIATHVIHNDPIFNILFPVLFGILIWTSLLLRDKRLQQLLKAKNYKPQKGG